MEANRSKKQFDPAAKWLRPALLLIILAGFGLRLNALTLQNIWWDEARNIDVALRPFLQVATAPELDIQPPIYYWLLHVWGRISATHLGGDPILIAFTMRFLSVAAGVGGVVLLYALTRQVASPLAGLLACFAGAFSPFWLAESQETRMYTLGFALLAAAALVFIKAIHEWDGETSASNLPGQRAAPARSLRFRYLSLFVVLSALALLTHYNAVFILVAWYIWWGIWALMHSDRWRRLRTIFISGLAMTALISPIAPIALRQIPGYKNPNLTVPSLAAYLRQNWQAYIGGYAFDPGFLNGTGNIWLWGTFSLAIGGLIVAAAFTWHRSRGRFNRRGVSFLLVWLLGGLGLYYIAVLDRDAFNVRYSSFVTPALYALLGIALAGWRRWWKPLALCATLVLGVGLVPAIHADLYDPRFAREDIAGVTRWLRKTTGPDDVIFVDQKYPFGFYYNRYTVDPNAIPMGPELTPARYLFVDINTIDQRLNQWAANARHVYWVQWFESDTDPRGAVAFLLNKEGRYAGEKRFQGYSINWWKLTPPNQFVLAPHLEPVHFVFPPTIQAVEMSLPQSAVRAGGRLPVVIRWQRVPHGTIERPLKARVALYNAAGDRLVQSDERVLNDRHLMPAEWSFDDRPLNVYMLELPDDLPDGDYALKLLVYDADTLQPLGLTDAAGNAAGVEATIATIAVNGPKE